MTTRHRDKLRSRDGASQRLSSCEWRDVVTLAVQDEKRSLIAPQLVHVVVRVAHKESGRKEPGGQRPKIGECRLEDDRRNRAPGGQAGGDSTAQGSAVDHDASICHSWSAADPVEDGQRGRSKRLFCRSAGSDSVAWILEHDYVEASRTQLPKLTQPLFGALSVSVTEDDNSVRRVGVGWQMPCEHRLPAGVVKGHGFGVGGNHAFKRPLWRRIQETSLRGKQHRVVAKQHHKQNQEDTHGDALASRYEGLDRPHRDPIAKQLELDAMIRIERNTERSIVMLGRAHLLDTQI